MITLRPDQSDLLQRVREELRTSRSVVMQGSTGFGKTVVLAQMLHNVRAKGKRAIMTVHRQELIDQTVRTFREFNLPHGIIAAGYTPYLQQQIQVASVDTLRARLKAGWRIPAVDLIAVDEGHHAVSASWSYVLSYFQNAKIILATATPERLDGKGLGEIADAMVCGPTTAELIDDGRLSPYRAFAPSTPSTEGLHVRMGDFIKSELAERMDKPTITGDAVSHYLNLARGKRAIVYCISVEHSKHVVAQFRAAGVTSWHIDGTTDKGERRAAGAAFASGDIQVLSNVELITEGYDCPAAEVCIMLRPTKSLSMYLQQVGRVLRPVPGKTALILDHAGNIARHGLPDDAREWSLAGRQSRSRRGDDEAPQAVRQCPVCYRCHKPAPTCAKKDGGCGHIYDIAAREVEHVDGVLEEIDVEMQRRERVMEQGQADTIEALIAIGKARNYQDPVKWALYVWTARMAKRNTCSECGAKKYPGGSGKCRSCYERKTA